MIRARQLVRTSVGYGAITGWLALLGLFTTPYMIHKLGTSRYGIFALISIMSAYLSNLEFGFGQATIRFLARARAGNDSAQARVVAETSFAVFLVVSLVTGALAFFGAPFVSHTFVHPASLRPEAQDAIRLGAIVLLASILTSFASASLQALARFDVVLKTRLIFGTLASASAVAAAGIGGGLRLVLAAQAVIASVIAAVLVTLLSRTVGGHLRPRPRLLTLRAMAAFGAFVLLAGLAYQLMLQGPPTILARYSTTAQVAAFAIPSVIFQNLVVVASSASLSFFPFVSAEAVKSDRLHLSAVYRANLRVTLMFMGPVVAYLAVFAHSLLSTWIGSRFAAHATAPLQFLSVAALVLAVGAPPADVARGLGRPGWVAMYTALTATVTISAAFIATPRYGAGGAAFALLFGLTVVTLPFVALVGVRLLHLKAEDLRRAFLRPVGALAIVTGFDVVGIKVSDGFLWALGVGAVGTSVYVVSVLKYVFDNRERDAVRGLYPRRVKATPVGASAVYRGSLGDLGESGEPAHTDP